MKRRTLLLGTSALVATGAAGYIWSKGATLSRAAASSLPRLQMPPLLDTGPSGRLELTAMAGETRFGGGEATPTIGFNQAYLGPTIRLKNGTLATRIRNSLSEAVTVHWHGLMVPGAHDGGPHLPIEPGGQWAPVLEIGQQASTAWYHTHVHGRTARQVHDGLAGVIHVVDGFDGERGLPVAYGVDDLTLVLQDRRFDSRGSMVYGLSMMDVMHGFAGDTIVVNGQVGAAGVVPRGIVRLRLVNGSNARIYTLFFDDGRPLHLIATDGGYLPMPLALDRLRLSPGERAEVLVDFSDGRTATLMSDADPNQGPGGMMGRLQGVIDRLVDRSFAVLPFAVDETMPAPITRIAEDLGGSAPELEGVTATSRRFSLDMGMGPGMMGPGMMGRGMMGGFAINGRPFDPHRIDVEARLGSVERWIVHSAILAHPFHIHGATFQVTAENGGRPRAENSGWKDTVLVDGMAELLVRFDQPASSDKPFMFHCHILEHEDNGMMGQLVVV